MDAAGDLRIFQTSCELQRLTEAVDLWEKARNAADTHAGGKYRGQYQTQVALIVKEVRGGAAAISGAVNQLRTDGATWPAGRIYQECARHDRRIIWLRRAWEYFRDKFDQRDDPALKNAVRAADEVLWSCYKPFYDGLGIDRPAPPLPYIENTYSPTALRPSDSGHLEKQAEIEEGPLQEFFTRLPVPLLQLPPICVTAPWILVLIGHETGHFIQDSVPSAVSFRTVFREQLQAIAKSTGGADAEAVWGRWAAEIFADLYSVAAMGLWAVWVMAQFELARPGKLTTRGKDYPSPLVRIWLLAQFASQAGLSGADSIVASLGVDAKQEAASSKELLTDLEVAAKVAPLILNSLPETGSTLPALLGLNEKDNRAAIGFDEPGEVVQWSEALRGLRQKADSNNVKAARLIAAAAARAWSEIIATQPAARDSAIRSLRSEAFPRMIRNAEGGTRGATVVSFTPTALADALFGMKDDDLFS
jgi:hypothetical protein